LRFQKGQGTEASSFAALMGTDGTKILFWDERMEKVGVTCPHCRAGFQRLELSFEPGTKGDYHCPVCDTVLESFDGDKLIAYRLTVRPSIRVSASKSIE